MPTPIVINGRDLAAQHLEHTAALIKRLKKRPHLAIILVGDNAPSQIYVRNKAQKTQEVGIESTLYHLPTSATTTELLKLVKSLSASKRINGILVQLPLPTHINESEIIAAIDPKKDVDGFTPENIGRLALKQDCLTPCTPLGCLNILKTIQPDLSRLNAVVIGRSKIVGRPLAQLLLNENCTVTIAHRHTRNLPALCATADILAVACGNPQMVKGSWIKKGAIVLDIGISYTETGKLSGDVVFAEAAKNARAITPVPGGVGPMTIAMLMSNTVKAYLLQHPKEAKTLAV